MLVSVPPPLGGAEVAVTTPVAADRAVPVPAEFDAFTYARSVWPTSADVSRRSEERRVVIAWKPPTSVSQRDKWYVYVVVERLKVPFVVVSVWRCYAVPVPVGNDAFVPAVLGLVVAVTTPVAADKAVPVPAEFDAFTYARSVWPTSADVSR